MPFSPGTRLLSTPISLVVSPALSGPASWICRRFIQHQWPGTRGSSPLPLDGHGSSSRLPRKWQPAVSQLMLWLPALLSPQLLKPLWYPGICWPWNLLSQHGVKALILIFFVLFSFGLTSCSWILPFNPTCVGGFVYFVSFFLYALPLSSCGLLRWYVISLSFSCRE